MAANLQMNQLGAQITAFFTFIGTKIRNFKNLSLGEQIAFCSVGAGFLLILVSLVLFIL